MGARALVVQENQVLLIKHTYMPEWHTIGGGVDPGETGLQAVIRELQEEVGIETLEEPSLFGFYHNTHQKHDDYVAFYVCTHFKRKGAKSREIEEAKWFPLHALPSDISPGTKRRIEEYLGERPISDRW
jgi:8-oxo-dGTP pyrophosphatase MutT (NUDIX family)